MLDPATSVEYADLLNGEGPISPTCYVLDTQNLPHLPMQRRDRRYHRSAHDTRFADEETLAAVRHTYNRLQFSRASVMSRGKKEDEFFRLKIELLANVRSEDAEEPTWAKVACNFSNKICVRGRNPAFYKARSERLAGVPDMGL